jgi:hypothetical protein
MGTNYFYTTNLNDICPCCNREIEPKHIGKFSATAPQSTFTINEDNFQFSWDLIKFLSDRTNYIKLIAEGGGEVEPIDLIEKIAKSKLRFQNGEFC